MIIYLICYVLMCKMAKHSQLLLMNLMINFIDIAELTMKMYDTYLDEPDHFIYLIQVDDNNDHESTDTNRS